MFTQEAKLSSVALEDKIAVIHYEIYYNTWQMLFFRAILIAVFCFLCFYPCQIILSYIFAPARGNDKETNSRMLTSPCRIAAYSGFSERFFHVFLKIKLRYLVVCKKNNSLFVWGWDRKICPSWSPFVTTRQASWCQSMVLGTDFSITSSNSWWNLLSSLLRENNNILITKRGLTN